MTASSFPADADALAAELARVQDALARQTAEGAAWRARAEAAEAEAAGLRGAALDASERQREKIEALMRAETLKTQFLGILSHELRTPINGVMGFASILEDELIGPLSLQQHGYVRKILSSSERLLALVEDLLDMSRIQAGKLALSPSPMAFAHVVGEMTAHMAPLLEQKNLKLRTELDQDLPIVRADEQRLGQVLLNLLSNAHKFTPPGGTITLRAVHAGEWLRCEVADTGEGIASEDLPKLFQPFSQLDMTATRKFGGAGLGLSICKSLVEAHGGHIGVSSLPGEGATFWFTVPIAQENRPAGLPDGASIAYNEA